MNGNDMKNLEIYKEIVEGNAKTAKEISIMSKNNALTAQALENLTINIQKLNDSNILHHEGIENRLDILNKWWFKVIILLIIALAMLAGIEKLTPFLEAFL